VSLLVSIEASASARWNVSRFDGQERITRAMLDVRGGLARVRSRAIRVIGTLSPLKNAMPPQAQSQPSSPSRSCRWCRTGATGALTIPDARTRLWGRVSFVDEQQGYVLTANQVVARAYRERR
jgi:hypothetical protein